MKVEPMGAPRLESSYKQRLSTFLDSRRGKMFGFVEVAALAGSCFVLLLVLISYLYFLVPARSRVASLDADRKQLKTNLQTLQGVVSKGRDTKDNVEKIGASLDKFETGYLVRADQGKFDLYDELNQLIIKNNLRNTSGPTYTPLDPSGTKSVSGRTTTTKWQSFYPGIAVMVTIEGQYADLRRFIRDIEKSKQFVVINEVELQRATENNAPTPAEESASSGSRGAPVSLQLNMATYFQRERAAGSNGEDQQQGDGRNQ